MKDPTPNVEHQGGGICLSQCWLAEGSVVMCTERTYCSHSHCLCIDEGERKLPSVQKVLYPDLLEIEPRTPE